MFPDDIHDDDGNVELKFIENYISGLHAYDC